METKKSKVATRGTTGQVGWVSGLHERLRLARPEMLALVRDVGGWKFVKHDIKKSKATIECREVSRVESGKPQSYKMWRCKVDLPATVDTVEKWISEPEKVKKWNPVLLYANRVAQVDKNLDIFVYAFQPFAGGLISSREFVTLRGKETLPTASSLPPTSSVPLVGSSVAAKSGWLLLAVGCDHASVPVTKDRVRGWTGPSGFTLEPLPSNGCRMTWLLNSDSYLPTALPQKLIDRAFIKLLVGLMRNLCTTLLHKK
jgi:hypothetical protein